MANSRVSSGIGREWAGASSANAAGNLQHSRPFFIPRIEVGYLRLSYCRGNARMSAGGGRSTPRLDRTGTNTLARYGRIRAGREYSAPGLCVECRLSRSSGAIKYRLVADEGADCDRSKKRATPLLFVLDWTYRLWQQFARFGLLHPVVLESLPAPTAKAGFSGATDNLKLSGYYLERQKKLY